MLGRRDRSGRARVLRKDRAGMNPVTAGAIAVAVILIGSYFGFAKHIPFTHGFRLQAVFQSAQSIRTNSPVRIAGVNVGKVTGVKSLGDQNAAVVTMEITKRGLPIHKDATLKIRPRIFLEGNYFVDIQPGTPNGPHLSDGDRVPITQTSTPVQLDQVLDALDSGTRESLQDLLHGYGTALTYKPTPADDRGQDPAVRGETAATSFNDSLKYGGPALRGTALVNQSLLGTRPGDLRRLVASFGRVAGALDRNEAQLQDLITNFNTTMEALASQEGNLRSSIRLLGPTVETANRALGSLDAALPATRAFAREILPGVRETPATIDASFPWIAQFRALLGQRELRGVARELSPATRDLSRITDRTLALLPQVDLLNRCVTHNLLPAGRVKLEDGAFSTGVENYKEIGYSFTGLAGEGQNFDGNGMYVRFQTGGGPQTIRTGNLLSGAAPLLANVVQAPLGTRPTYTGRLPPYRPDVACYRNALPDLNGPLAGPGPGTAPVAAAASAPEASAASRGGGR
jgi:phospholipid/cholesterol/gamma-HCH transport system substrate-binding protein